MGGGRIRAGVLSTGEERLRKEDGLGLLQCGEGHGRGRVGEVGGIHCCGPQCDGEVCREMVGFARV